MILEYTFIYSIHISPSNSILLCKALCTVHSISTQHTVGCLGAGALEQLLHSDLSELGPCTQASAASGHGRQVALLFRSIRRKMLGGRFLEFQPFIQRLFLKAANFLRGHFFRIQKFVLMMVNEVRIFHENNTT